MENLGEHARHMENNGKNRSLNYRTRRDRKFPGQQCRSSRLDLHRYHRRKLPQTKKDTPNVSKDTHR